ncbi:hypothetical protein DFH29DRAFT_882932, partial [Suillus ampliporus]
MGPPISIRNNNTPGPSVIVEDIFTFGPWSTGPYHTGYYAHAPFEDSGDDEGDLDGGDGGDLGQEHDWEDEPMDVEGQDNETYDVLEHHQAQNGQCKAPSPFLLANTHLDVTTAQDLLINARLNIMATRDLVNVCHLQVPLLFERRLPDVDIRCLIRIILLLAPEHQDAMQLAQEVLDAKLWVCHQKKLKFENGKFSLYCRFLPVISCLIARLLSGVWPTDVPAELKKVVISIAKLSYNIFPKGTMMQPEEIKNCIVAAATKLLKTGDYLWIPDSSNGKFKNFVLQALKDVCLKFFYSNSKKALKNTDDFHHTISVNALILVAAMKGVISGSVKPAPTKTDFDKLWKSVEKLLDIPERREELKEMLDQWAKIGMGEFDWHADGSDAGSDVGGRQYHTL